MFKYASRKWLYGSVATGVASFLGILFIGGYLLAGALKGPENLQRTSSQTTTQARAQVSSATAAPLSTVSPSAPVNNPTASSSSRSSSQPQTVYVPRTQAHLEANYTRIRDYLNNARPGRDPSAKELEQIHFVMQGYNNGDLGLSNPLTRAQAATIMVRMLEQPSSTSTGTSFSDVDVSNDVHRGNIQKIYEIGVTKGCATNPLRYCPADQITARQFAIMMARGIQYKQIRNSFNVQSSAQYNDLPSAGQGREEIDYLWQRAIFATGCTNNTPYDKYCPQAGLTRGKAVEFIADYYQLLNASHN